MTTRRKFLIAGVGTLAVPLTACGGGSDSEAMGLADPSVTPPQAPPTPPPTVPPPAPPPPGTPPSAPPGYEDPILIYDGKGGITGAYLYNGLIPWKNPLGDWLDADGVAQGTKPFGQTSVATNQTGQVTIDVTKLVALGGEPSLCLSARSSNPGFAPTLVFNSRESGAGAKLAVKYQDGTTDSIPVMYDTECNVSTAYELGSKPTLTLGGINVYLRFPAPAKPVASATLVLQINRIWQGGQIVVYRFALHRDPIPPDRMTLKGDPRVFLETEAFDDTPFYLRAQIFGDVPHGAYMDTYHQRAVVDIDGGGRALEVTFDPRVNGALSASVCFPNFDEANEAAWEFDIRLMPNMVGGLQDGIKCFAGCSSSTKNDDAYFAGWAGTHTPGRSGTLLAGNGGSKSHGYDGWSMRWDMWNTPPAPHPLNGRFMPMQYAYWPLQTDFFGDPWSWRLNHASLQVGRWYTITQRAKINSCVGTTFKPDAELDGYIDHVLALRKRDFYLRTTDNPLIAQPPYNVRSKLAIGRIWINTWHGGTSLPLARCSFQVKNFRAAKFA